jgi:hypothetical protein
VGCSGEYFVSSCIEKRSGSHPHRATGVDHFAFPPAADWLITVIDDSQPGLAEVVAGVIATIEAYVAKHGLQKEASSIDGYDNVGVIAIRCSARLKQVIEEFPDVLAIEQSQSNQAF